MIHPPIYALVLFAQGCRGGRAVQGQPGGRVLSVPGSQEPAHHQGAGECQTALFQVLSAVCSLISLVDLMESDFINIIP